MNFLIGLFGQFHGCPHFTVIELVKAMTDYNMSIRRTEPRLVQLTFAKILSEGSEKELLRH